MILLGCCWAAACLVLLLITIQSHQEGFIEVIFSHCSFAVHRPGQAKLTAAPSRCEQAGGGNQWRKLRLSDASARIQLGSVGNNAVAMRLPHNQI